MKKHLFLLTICFSVLFASCATKIEFDQTCLTCINSQRLLCKEHECPVTAMVGTDCIVMMSETGEKITVNEILQQEGLQIRGGINLTLAKIRGRYFITGEGFKHLWMLAPVANQAKIKKYVFPHSNLAMPPVFEISKKNLLMRGAKEEYKYIFNIDTEKWETDNTTPKAGA